MGETFLKAALTILAAIRRTGERFVAYLCDACIHQLKEHLLQTRALPPSHCIQFKSRNDQGKRDELGHVLRKTGTAFVLKCCAAKTNGPLLRLMLQRQYICIYIYIYNLFFL